jgi:23S rRNA pseudouridine955/2504/2580 synthase
MSGVEIRDVGPDEADLRLDRWFRLHFPTLGHGRLQRLLRTGQVRVDGKRAKAGLRLKAGQQVRVPPLGEAAAPDRKRGRGGAVSDSDAAFVRSLVLYRDDAVIALNKPSGLAVQGGTGTVRHLDAMLDALRFGYDEAPRLVHRLDRDTSGVLLLGRTRTATAALAKSFRSRTARKIYWAVTAGVPPIAKGKIDLPLEKRLGPAGERVEVDRKTGRQAVTWYRVVETAASRFAWVALWPRTGRTHQLRVHCTAIGCPILGDAKYCGADAMIGGDEIPRGLHLHARELALPHPAGTGEIIARAPLPDHMMTTWALFGFDPEFSDDPFAEEP